MRFCGIGTVALSTHMFWLGLFSGLLTTWTTCQKIDKMHNPRGSVDEAQKNDNQRSETGENEAKPGPEISLKTFAVNPMSTSVYLRNGTLKSSIIHVYEIEQRSDVDVRPPFVSVTVRTNAPSNSPIFVYSRSDDHSYNWKVPWASTPRAAHQTKIIWVEDTRTLCRNSSSIVLELSTLSSDFVEYELAVVALPDQSIGLGGSKSLTNIQPMEQKLIYFQMPPRQDGILVKLTSEDDLCAEIKLDSVTCMDYEKQDPYYDDLELEPINTITQTMTRIAAITVYRKDFKLFHIIVSIPGSNKSCSSYGNPRIQKLSGPFFGHQIGSKNISITINSIKQESYFAILYYPVIVATMACIVLVVCICPPLAAYMEYPERPIYERPKLTKKEKIKIPDTVKGSFLFSLLVIAAFYSLPALQLLYYHQRLYRTTGKQDVCYYNFLCLRPLGSVIAFNNVYSNLSYVIFGLTFLVMVRVHSRRLAWRYREVFYSMGMALTLEGFLSAGYHICPTAHNFQFDTTFMYIIAGLCIYHLYQIRNPHVTSHPYKFYGIFAGAGIFVVMGIFSSEIGWRVSVTVAYGITAILVGAIVMNKLYIRNMLAKSHRTAQRILGGIQSFLTLMLIAYSLYCLIEDPDSFPSVLLNIFVGNLFFFTIFYFALKIANREALVAGSILCTILALASWAASFYFYTGGRITNWQLAPAGSRALNAECIFLDFFDSHDVWHMLSSFSLFVSFILLLTLDDGLIFGAQQVTKGVEGAIERVSMQEQSVQTPMAEDLYTNPYLEDTPYTFGLAGQPHTFGLAGQPHTFGLAAPRLTTNPLATGTGDDGGGGASYGGPPHTFGLAGQPGHTFGLAGQPPHTFGLAGQPHHHTFGLSGDAPRLSTVDEDADDDYLYVDAEQKSPPSSNFATGGNLGSSSENFLEKQNNGPKKRPETLATSPEMGDTSSAKVYKCFVDD